MIRERQTKPGGASTATAPEAGTGVPRICLLTETYHPIVGGGETQARLLAESLLGRGAEVVVLTRRVSLRHPTRETMAGVEIHRLPLAGRGRLGKWSLLLTALFGLVRLRHRYDLILVSGFRILGLPAVLAAGAWRKRCVLKADSLGELSGEYFTAGLARWGLKPSSPLIRLLLVCRNRLLRKADAFVAISSPVRDELLDNGVPAARIRTIPNAVDTARFRPLPASERAALRHRLGVPFEDRIVTYTGRLVSYKGLPLLLQVWRELHRRHPRAGLLLVGSGGLDIHNCEAEIRRYVGRHGLEDSVHFTGDVDNVERYLQISDVFAFPTEREAFGISLIEAMACGLPTVSTTVGGLRDIVEDRVNALSAPPGEEHRWTAALDSLMCDQAQCQRLGEAGRRTAEQLFSSAEISQRYLELFESTVR